MGRFCFAECEDLPIINPVLTFISGDERVHHCLYLCSYLFNQLNDPYLSCSCHFTLCLCVLLLVWTLFSFHGFLFFYLDLITALSKAHFLFLTCRLVCLTFGSHSVYPDIISVHICIQRRQRNYWCCQFKPETIEDVAYHLFIMDRNVIFFSIHTWQNVFHHKNERIISSRTFL